MTAGLRVLVVNAGSSSLKVDLVQDGRAVTSYDGLPDRPPEVDAVGHRIVHGGPDLVDPVVLDAAVEQQLRDLVELAPLHQPKSLDGLAAAQELLPDVPHVACFDTAFHTTLPAAASTFALPQEWRKRWGVRRYGFHGLSHSWASSRAGQLVPGARRVITCHLGAGASLAAVLDGRSVDTTMGFTPLAGLVMATRSGSIDPGLLLWLEEHEGLRPAEVADALEHASGLLALAGTADMRQILTRSDERARLALDVYLHSLATHVAGMTVALGGLDTLVFTGGVGERAPAIRSGAAERLAHLGVAVDPDRNDAVRSIDGDNPDADITGADSRVRTLVVRAREDLQIAAGVVQALGHRART
ncbi:acetate/propionate family kinase [Blastococcus haudaquaticus]|uniref:Acetate kinase n=1 Tax=Blastococcus haudaquaticus TaxID=1938745 RepID=A0A286GRJ0_9ACTN|nr:acetate/propionate family kinase [Blastococcus haudaquaticus]SOD97564.1 acetate kinase [Blastococcus haudaquaticus]